MRLILPLAALAAMTVLASCQTPSTAYMTSGASTDSQDRETGTVRSVPAHRNPWDYPDFQLNKS